MAALPAPAPRGTAPAHPLAPLADNLLGSAAADPFGWMVEELAHDLLAIDPDWPDALVAEGTRLCRIFLSKCWESLEPDHRAAELAKAREELGDLIDAMTEPQAEQAVEEVARDRLRQAYPALTTATLWALVSP